MKRSKLSLLGIVVLAVVSLLSSCEPESITAPLVTVNPSEDGTAAPGETVTYEMIVSSDTDLNSVVFEASANEVVFAIADTTFPANALSAVLNFAMVVPEDMALETVITLNFFADNQGESTEVTRSLTVTRMVRQISEYTAVIMSDLENPNGSSFFSLDENMLMTLSQARDNSEKVDLIYYFGNTNQATLCASTDEDVKAFTDSNEISIVDQLATKNNTELALLTLTAADFAGVTDDTLIEASTPGEVFTAVNQLETGQVLYAKTVSGKKALILVSDITGGQGTSEITIEVKIQN